MNPNTFPLTPLAIAISAVLMFGCSTDKAPLATLEPIPSKHPSDVQEKQSLTKKVDAIQQHSQSLRLTAPADSEADAAHAPATAKEPLSANAPFSAQVARRTKASKESEERSASSQPRLRTERANAGIALSAPLHADHALQPPHYSEPAKTDERFASFTDHSIKSVSIDPVSTFGIDVDTASYAIARQDLNNGRLPSPESARIEEWLNYFRYSYPIPSGQEQPFSISTEIAPSPWSEHKQLLRIGLKGYEVDKSQLPPLNLTFLIDVSGSMQAQNKLPLAKTALKLLTQQLRAQDRVSIVVYAGAAGLVLDSASGSDKARITQALEQLRAGGSTAGGAGIQLAYTTARKNHSSDSISRVILLGDGDMNLGTTTTEALKKMVAQQRSSGVSLSVLTFGRGNIRDELMNALAEIGNGNAGYIDSAHEARKYLVDEMSGSLMTIAKDVKTQIEFNGALVSEYRLLGYETRQLQNHEFNDDRKDAGEIGAGHEVTALYELTLKGSAAELTPALRYSRTSRPNTEPRLGTGPKTETDPTQLQELAYLKLRYKEPDSDHSTLISQPIYRHQIRSSLAESSADFRWAAAVAGAAQRARGHQAIGDWNYSHSIALAQQALGSDAMGYRAEFLRMLRLAASLEQQQQLSRTE